jgi:hypothetical protein
MKTLAIFPLILAVVLVGCGKRQTTRISDVTKPATLTLTPALGQGTNVHGLWFRIRGKTDGLADIWGTDLHTNRVGGRFEMKRSGEYYSPKCVIEYRPVGVRTGQISIEYEFGCVD